MAALLFASVSISIFAPKSSRSEPRISWNGPHRTQCLGYLARLRGGLRQRFEWKRRPWRHTGRNPNGRRNECVGKDGCSPLEPLSHIGGVSVVRVIGTRSGLKLRESLASQSNSRLLTPRCGQVRTGLRQQSNQSPLPRNGNWKKASGDRPPKPAPKGRKCQKLPARDRRPQA
jgi:hypothetical protein